MRAVIFLIPLPSTSTVPGSPRFRSLPIVAGGWTGESSVWTNPGPSVSFAARLVAIDDRQQRTGCGVGCEAAYVVLSVL
jgi:hypothetical protein